MEQKSESMRERLLARMPQPENYTGYCDEVAAEIAKREKRLRLTWWGTAALWTYVVAFFLMLTMWREGNWLVTPHGHVVELVWLFMTIFGAVEWLKYFISRSRVDVLKEIKQIQLQVLELQASIAKSGEKQG